jgi:hypothetical protein
MRVLTGICPKKFFECPEKNFNPLNGTLTEIRRKNFPCRASSTFAGQF